MHLNIVQALQAVLAHGDADDVNKAEEALANLRGVSREAGELATPTAVQLAA